MPLEIVRLPETWVAGLPVRSPKRALGQLSDPDLATAWSSVLAQDIGGPLASIYTDYSAGIGSYNTQIVGYRADPGSVARGHIVARVAAGSYAKFSSVGSFPQIMVDLWKQVDGADERNELVRANSGEYEFYPHAYKIELFVPVIERARSR